MQNSCYSTQAGAVGTPSRYQVSKPSVLFSTHQQRRTRWECKLPPIHRATRQWTVGGGHESTWSQLSEPLRRSACCRKCIWHRREDYNYRGRSFAKKAKSCRMWLCCLKSGLKCFSSLFLVCASGTLIKNWFQQSCGESYRSQKPFKVRLVGDGSIFSEMFQCIKHIGLIIWLKQSS